MFKLYRSKGVINNSFVSDVPAGTSLDTNAELIQGTAVVITSGLLEVGATNGSIAGILVTQPGVTSYGLDAQGAALGNVAKLPGENPLFMPVGRETLIEADLAAAGAVVLGTAYDIAAGGATVDRAAVVNGDFKVLRVTEGTAASATKVMGVFTDPTGYFA